MQAFYYPNHSAHDHAILHQPDNPRTAVYYADVAQRATVIHDALMQANIANISAPDNFGMDPIAEVHQYDLLKFLETAYHQMKKETGSEIAIPETFSVGRRPPHKPVSIWGLLGYYCFDTSAPIFKGTWEAAYWSAQTALSAAEFILSEKEQFAYALCRPPGHHASTDMYGGYCYLNNVAIAAQRLVSDGHRVAILDLDFHHGNGTQSIFYGRADVLTCSLHADPLHQYPFYWGFADEYGVGAGINHNFNFPLPLGTQEPRYLTALDVALRQIQIFVPDMLILAFGADTAVDDQVGGFKLTVDSYGRIGQKIAALNLPTVIIQEGGYRLSHLGDCVVSLLKGIEAK
jgi:acetoin utilization deacetylase AcuC-like enzyme